LVDPVRVVDVLSFSVVVEFFINWLVAGEGGKTGDIERGAWGGGVGHIGGSGADTAGAKTREEGSTVVLLGEGHLEGIGRERGRLVGLFKGAGDGRGSTRVESKRKGDLRRRRGEETKERVVESRN
jgi:hypothetical protein